MFSDLASIRTAVKDRLEPLLPDTWRWVPYADTLTTAATPIVYIEFTEIASMVNGEPLGPGQCAPGLNLIVTDPLTDTEKAENAVDEHVLRLIHALESSNDLYWSTATKRRLENGQMAWVIPVTALAETPDPTEGN